MTLKCKFKKNFPGKQLAGDSDVLAEDLVGTLQVLEVIAPAVHRSLLPEVLY